MVIQTVTDQDGNEKPVYPTNNDSNETIPVDAKGVPIILTDKDQNILVPQDSDGNPL